MEGQVVYDNAAERIRAEALEESRARLTAIEKQLVLVEPQVAALKQEAGTLRAMIEGLGGEL